MAYRAFGEELENTGTGTAPKYSYTGKELDSSGLYYYGARYYDPALSRFITPDTVYDAGPQGLNRYSYALNNPIRYNDPSGHMSNPFATFFRGLHSSPVGKLVGNLMRTEAQATAEAAEHQVRPPEQDAGVVEGSFPIWGDGKDSYLAFKEGKILYGMLYGIMALNDVADGGVSPEDAAKAGIRGGRGLAEKAVKKGVGLVDGEFDMALGLARHQETGSPFLLKNFSKHVNAKNYGDIYGRWWPGSMEKLRKNIGDAMNSADNLHFNLDQFDIDAFKKFTKNPEFAEENITNWELYK